MVVAGLALAAATLLMVGALNRPSSNLAVLSGVSLAAASWLVPCALGFAPLVAAPLADRRHPFRARLHIAGSAALGLAFGLLPRAVRG